MGCSDHSLGDLTGRVAVVTGATRGIGRAVAEGLAGLGASLVVVARKREDGEAVAAGIRERGGDAEVVRADLGSQASIRAAAAEVEKRHPRIDLLVNNAAIVPRRREVTEDGVERQLAVNHLAPFLLTNLLLERLKAAAPSRIVTVSSTAHLGQRIAFDDLMSERDYRRGTVYGRTKLANILFTRELARRLAGTGVTANTLHPGVVATRLLADYMGVPFGGAAARMIGKPPSRGAETVLYLAASPELDGVTGKYFDDCRETAPSAAATDAAAALRLWEVSARLTSLS